MHQQLDSSLSNNEVISIIEQSSHLFPYGNNYVGYGVPSCKKIYDGLTNETFHQVTDSQQNFIRCKKNRINVKLQEEQGTAIIFHKSDIKTVCVQTKIKFADFNLFILRPKNTNYSTLTLGNFVREIKWT